MVAFQVHEKDTHRLLIFGCLAWTESRQVLKVEMQSK